jgi:hypothetical protein
MVASYMPICSEDQCNIHDWDMVLDHEDGKRPRGRNPWRGFCLRIAALDRLRPERSNEGSPEGQRPADDLEIEERISSVIQREVQRVIAERFPPSAPKRQQRHRTGGTPL